MKKIVFVLTAVLMLMLALPSLAEVPEVWALWTVDAQYNFDAIGCAVADSESTLLTASAVTDDLPKGISIIAEAPDGRYEMVDAVKSDGLLSHLTLLDQQSELKPVTPGVLMTGMMEVVYLSSDRMVDIECSLGGRLTVLDTACMLMSTDDTVPYGSPVFSYDGAVRGIVAAEYNDGEYQYVVVPLTEIIDVTAFSKFADSMVNMSFTVDGPVIHFEWDASAVTTASLYVQDLMNSFYSSHSGLIHGEAYMTGVPGHSYAAWLLDGVEELPDSMPNGIVTVPKGEPYEIYDFQTVDQYIGLMPDSIGEYTADLSERLDKVTRSALLTKGYRPVWQIVNTYTVDQKIDMNMVICMVFPDGTTIMATKYGNMFSMMSDIQENDVWSMSLDSVLESYISIFGSIPTGTYRLECYFETQPAIEYTFEVTE